VLFVRYLSRASTAKPRLQPVGRYSWPRWVCLPSYDVNSETAIATSPPPAPRPKLAHMETRLLLILPQRSTPWYRTAHNDHQPSSRDPTHDSRLVGRADPCSASSGFPTHHRLLRSHCLPELALLRALQTVFRLRPRTSVERLGQTLLTMSSLTSVTAIIITTTLLFCYESVEHPMQIDLVVACSPIVLFDESAVLLLAGALYSSRQRIGRWYGRAVDVFLVGALAFCTAISFSMAWRMSTGDGDGDGGGT
jgi:hypothetical protein